MQRQIPRRFVDKVTTPDLTVPEGGYVVIGDTITALLYTYNLFMHFSSRNPPLYPPIYLLTEGPDFNETKITCTARADFVVDNARDMVAHLNATTIHLIPYDRNYFSSSSSASENSRDLRIIIEDTAVEDSAQESFTYYTGRGISGDIVGSYYNPRFGPYMRGIEGVSVLNFVANNGVMGSVSSTEKRIMESLREIFSLTIAKSDAASMAYKNQIEYVFMAQRSDGELSRKIFKNKYEFLSSTQAPNVTIYTGCNVNFTNPDGRSSNDRLQRDESNEAKTWDVEINRNLPTIRQAKVIFKCNPYDQLRIAGRGGMRNFILDIPVTYRAVLRYDLQTSTTRIITDPDGLMSHVSFTLCKDLKSNDNDPITWIISAYTTFVDYADVTLRTSSGSANSVLLIVEAINLLSSRKAEYDYENLGVVDVRLQEPSVEENYRQDFADIVAKVYRAFSGQNIPVETVLGAQQICVERGPCTTESLITSFPHRETPLDVVYNAAVNSSSVNGTGYNSRRTRRFY